MRELVQSRLQMSVGANDRLDWYRLAEGRVEFRAAGTKDWQALNYPEIEHHLQLNTPVGKWLGHLNSLGELARVLCSAPPDEVASGNRSRTSRSCG
jgi:hypothetical protein